MILIVFAINSIMKSQTFEWAKHIGSTSGSQGYAIATDNLGNVYSTGFSSGTTFFNLPATSPSLLPSYSQYGYVTKHDSSGNILWVKQFGGGSTVFPLAMDVDNAGNVYTSGFFSDSTDFDPGPGIFKLGTSPSTLNSYISKLDAAGNFVWAKKFGGAENYTFGISVDDSNNVFVTGRFLGTADFDPGSGVYNLVSAGYYDIFISKLNASGNLVWAKGIGSAGLDMGSSVKADNTGSLYVTGFFRDTLDFDPGAGVTTFMSGGGDDVFLSKFDTSGNQIWTRQISGTADEDGNSLAVDADGNCYVTGLFVGTANFDPGLTNSSRTSNGAEDIYIAKYDPSGGLAWVKSFGGVYSDDPFSIACSGTDLYISGNFSDVVDFDAGPGVFSLNSIWGGIHPFVSKYNTSGNFAWAAQMSGMSDAYGMAVATDTLFNVYLTGFYSYGYDFNPSPLAADTFNMGSISSQDVFIVRLSQTICSSMALVLDSVSSLTCSSSGNAFVYARGGLEPYSYLWSTTPPTTDSAVIFIDKGIYQLTVSDSNSCTRTMSLLINGPDTISGFDLEANLVGDDFRPGYEANIWVDASNNNCSPISGILMLILDTSKVTFSYSFPYPDYITIASDTLIWNFTDLGYDSLHFVPQISLQTNTTAMIGDTVCLKIAINPMSGDIDSLNNTKNYCFPIVNGFDPNEKSVYPAGECANRYVLNVQKLTYTVHFQNTGNSNAININVLDSIDADLDLNSVNVIASSHPLITEILPGNVLKFRFDNILLPYQAADELLSNGYFIYEVNPLSGKPDGTQIKNHADIYFDYNSPVITDTTLNTLVSAIPNCNLLTNLNPVSKNSGRLYPNPAGDLITIDDISVNSTIKVYDLFGKLIITFRSNSTKCVIETRNLQNGVFLIEIINEYGSRGFQKVVVNKMD
ncbi:MAG: SBBP repeat-containing protein [Bacteroidia bacterium]